MDRVYLSEISRWWTIERQTEVLSAAIDGWPKSVQVYTDLVHEKDRRSRCADLLTARQDALRPTGRPTQPSLYVASLAVLAWTEDDLINVVSGIIERGWMLFSVDDHHSFGSPSPAQTVRFVAERASLIWKGARIKSRLEGAAKRGGAVSARVRGDRVSAGVEKIKDRWPLPSSEWSTAALLAEAGVSRNGVNARLGGREKAQIRYQAALKRKMKRSNPNEQA